MKLRTGVVKWYDNKNNYGMLIAIDDEPHSGEDIFFHKSAILVQGEQSLPNRTMVTFELTQSESVDGNNGLKAIKVRPNNIAEKNEYFPDNY